MAAVSGSVVVGTAVADYVAVTVSVPEVNIQVRNIELDRNDTVWNNKNFVIKKVSTANLEMDLKDSVNYGLFLPPANGRTGKFLEEERRLREYSVTAETKLELRYKKREYRTNMSARKLAEFNSKTYRKKFILYVKLEEVTKMSKLLDKGLDPNFQEEESGETPLTLAVVLLPQPLPVMMSLVEGGARLDYRTRTGLTAMHRAAQSGKRESIKALLDLGASPNSLDEQGLTPLYYCVSSSNDIDPFCIETLLKDYAKQGYQDNSGSTELHQACRHGRSQHVEHLLYYGADMNVVNKNGNTALHVCALNNQEACARILLFRGADKTVLNFANQDAAQLALLCGHAALAKLIEQFNSAEAVPHREKPAYNIKRRGTFTRTKVSTYSQLTVSREVSGMSNLIDIKALSSSTPNLSEDSRPFSSIDSSPKSDLLAARQQKMLVNKGQGDLSHLVGVPVLNPAGQVELKFFQTDRQSRDPTTSPGQDSDFFNDSFDSDVETPTPDVSSQSKSRELYINTRDGNNNNNRVADAQSDGIYGNVQEITSGLDLTSLCNDDDDDDGGDDDYIKLNMQSPHASSPYEAFVSKGSKNKRSTKTTAAAAAAAAKVSQRTSTFQSPPTLREKHNNNNGANVTASIRTSHKRMTASILCDDTFVVGGAGSSSASASDWRQTQANEHYDSAPQLPENYGTPPKIKAESNRPKHPPIAIHALPAPPFSRTGTSPTNVGVLVESRKKFGGSADDLLEETTPARRKPLPPPPTKQKSGGMRRVGSENCLLDSSQPPQMPLSPPTQVSWTKVEWKQIVPDSDRSRDAKPVVRDATGIGQKLESSNHQLSANNAVDVKSSSLPFKASSPVMRRDDSFDNGDDDDLPPPPTPNFQLLHEADKNNRPLPPLPGNVPRVVGTPLPPPPPPVACQSSVLSSRSREATSTEVTSQLYDGNFDMMQAADLLLRRHKEKSSAAAIPATGLPPPPPPVPVYDLPFEFLPPPPPPPPAPSFDVASRPPQVKALPPPPATAAKNRPVTTANVLTDTQGITPNRLKPVAPKTAEKSPESGASPSTFDPHDLAAIIAEKARKRQQNLEQAPVR